MTKNILFIHQNFPAQFKHLAPALVERGDIVSVLTMRDLGGDYWNGVRVFRYGASRDSSKEIHPWLKDFETKTIRAEACFRAALDLKERGYNPDAIVAHPGWGEALFLRRVWPDARLGLYCELYYQERGADSDFDPEFPVSDPDGNACRLQLKNLNNILQFRDFDAAISPTHWQAATFPDEIRDRITVVHDGVDTDKIKPNSDVSLGLQRTGSDQVETLTRSDEVVTFVNRNLEPMRGFHRFMRAVPELLRQRPRALILVVGGDDVSYGSRPTIERHGHRSWKEVFVNEVRPQLTDEQWSRLHFLGKLPYGSFIGLLQISTVHVYLTYPFVLSWSLIEAMSAGAAIVASDTAPVREILSDDETARLVDFFDGQKLIEAVSGLLDDAAERDRLGSAARSAARGKFDLRSVCLPQQLEWVDNLLAKS